MARAKFTKDFDYRVPGKPATVAYKKGWSGTVPEAHIDAAVAAGAAEPAKAAAKAD